MKRIYPARIQASFVSLSIYIYVCGFVTKMVFALEVRWPRSIER